MKYVLAIDGGGTKTKVICADESGQILGEGQSGPTSLTATSVGAASLNLREGIRQAVEKLPAGFQISNLVMGLAGMDTPQEEEQSRQVFSQVLAYWQIADFNLVNDIAIALASGSDNPNAVALISGTGSNCFGRNDHGETAKTGGYDFLLTDQGSGYEIGRSVLRAAVKSFDGRGPDTRLEQLVCDHFRIASIAELKSHVYNPPLAKSEVATLAPLCLKATQAGDEIADNILHQAADELALMATTVIKKLQLQEVELDLVMAGSILGVESIRLTVEGEVKLVAPKVIVQQLITDPVMGALKMALSATKT